jgi:hypothetical protein
MSPVFEPAGYDLSFPLPNFHSFVLHHRPNVAESGTLENGLNEAGLVTTTEDVERLAAQANGLSLNWAPFCTFQIWLRT